jgi:hypothetical protein
MNKRMVTSKILLACLVIVITWRGIDQFPSIHNYVEQQKVTVGTIAHIRTSSKEVALVLDIYDMDAPVTEVVRLLDREQAKATFLLSQDWAKEHPLTRKELEKRGYEIRGLERIQGWSFDLEQMRQEDGTIDPAALRDHLQSGGILRLSVKPDTLSLLPVALHALRDKGMAICTLRELESERK